MRYVFRHKLALANGHQFTVVFGAVIYGFSPYVAALIIPGHFYILVTYAFFPLIIKHLDLLLSSENFNYKSFLILFLIFMACAPGFANIGIIYVLLIACLIYATSLFFISRSNLILFGTRFCLFVSSIFLSNAWWLFPHLSNLKHVVAMSQSSATSITAGVSYASTHATLLNIFLGRPQYMMYMRDIVGNDYYVAGPIMWIFASILLFFMAGLFFKKKYIYVLLCAMLASIFFVKGPQPPLSDLFMWAYEHIPGFQIFRRPDSKFYGFFLFFYWAIAVAGYALIFKKYAYSKLRALLLFLAGLASAGYMVVIFSMTGGLIPFNIPPMYEKANDLLLKDKVTRLLLLPSTYGLCPVYTEAVNSYNSRDFINDAFAFSIIFPDSTQNFINEAYRVPTNDLMHLIREGKPICDAARCLGVSHIMVRQDLDPSQPVEDKAVDLIALLDRHPDISKKVIFDKGRGLTVYRLCDECADPLISAKRDGAKLPSFHFSVQNPGKIILQFDSLTESVQLDFLTNFNENWKIYPYKDASLVNANADFNSLLMPSSRESHLRNIFSFFTDIQYLFRSDLFQDQHVQVNGYANGWRIDPRQIKQGLPPPYYHANQDGSVNFQLILYYQTQAYVCVGFVITLLTFGVFLVLFLQQKSGHLKMPTHPRVFAKIDQSETKLKHR